MALFDLFVTAVFSLKPRTQGGQTRPPWERGGASIHQGSVSVSGAAASHAEGADGRRLCQPIPADDGVEQGLYLVVDLAVGGEAVAREKFAILGMPWLDIVGGVADQVVRIDASHAALVATPCRTPVSTAYD